MGQQQRRAAAVNLSHRGRFLASRRPTSISQTMMRPAPS